MVEDLAVPATQCYSVEVSGWDCARNFFVERCGLLWSEVGEKRVRLPQDLLPNCIVFVRLLQANHSEPAHFVAYEAEFVGESLDGAREFRLKMVVPRPREVPAWR